MPFMDRFAHIPAATNALVQRVFRILRTGLAFLVFGLGGLVIGLVVFPCLYLISRPSTRQIRGRKIISWSFRTFVHLMSGLGLLTYHLNGLDKVNGPCLLVANHPSLIDVVFLCGWVRGANCLIKPSLFNNPITAGPIRGAGYINSDADEVSTRVKQALDQGEVIVIFPEGTRSVPGAPLKFRRGAAHFALAHGAPLHPVHIAVAPSTLTKAEAWWQVPAQRPHFELTVHDAWLRAVVQPTTSHTDPRSLGARQLTADLEQFLAPR